VERKAEHGCFTKTCPYFGICRERIDAWRQIKYNAIDDCTPDRDLKSLGATHQSSSIDFINYVVEKFPGKMATTARGPILQTQEKHLMKC